MSRKNNTGTEKKPVRNESGQKTASQRIAAENQLLDQLRSLLPIPEDIKPDKLSVLRLVIAYMKNRQDLSDIIDASARLSLSDDDEDSDADLGGDDDFISDCEGRATQKIFTPSTDIILPESLLSHIEEQLASREGVKDDAVLQEQIMKYKEGLERGINDFLQQSPPGKVVKYNRNKVLPELRVARLKSFTRKKSLLKQEQYVLPKEGSMALEIIDGFVMVLTPELTVTYVSSNVARYLGHCPFSIMGQSIELFLHPKDFKKLQEFRDEIVKGDYDKSKYEMGMHATFLMAMRFCFQMALTRLKSTGYSTIKWNIKCRYRFDLKSGVSKLTSFVCICQLHHSEAVMDVKLGGTMFMSRHSLDFSYTHIEPNVLFLTGYSPEEIISHGVVVMNCSCFGFHRPKKKGESSTSGYFRFMTQDGRWIWCHAQFRTVYSSRGEAQFIETKTYIVRLEDVIQSCYDNIKSKKQGKKAIKDVDRACHSNENGLESIYDAWVNHNTRNGRPRHCNLVIPKMGFPNKIRLPDDEISVCKIMSAQLQELIAAQQSPDPQWKSHSLTDHVEREQSSPEGSAAIELLDHSVDVRDVLPELDLKENDLNPLKKVDVAYLLQSPSGKGSLYSAMQDTANDMPLLDRNNFSSSDNNNSSPDLQVLSQRLLSDPRPSLPPKYLSKEENSTIEMKTDLKDGLGSYEMRMSRNPVTHNIGHTSESHQENGRLFQDLSLISRSSMTSVESYGNLFPAVCQTDSSAIKDTTTIDDSYSEIQTAPSFGDEIIIDGSNFDRNEVLRKNPHDSRRSPFIESSEFPDSPCTSSISSVNNHSDTEGSTPYLTFSPSSQLILSDQDESVNPDTNEMFDLPPDLTDLNMELCHDLASGSVAPMLKGLDNDTIFDVYLN